jgi:hypothetical protein
MPLPCGRDRPFWTITRGQEVKQRWSYSEDTSPR